MYSSCVCACGRDREAQAKMTEMRYIYLIMCMLFVLWKVDFDGAMDGEALVDRGMETLRESLIVGD